MCVCFGELAFYLVLSRSLSLSLFLYPCLSRPLFVIVSLWGWLPRSLSLSIAGVVAVVVSALWYVLLYPLCVGWLSLSLSLSPLLFLSFSLGVSCAFLSLFCCDMSFAGLPVSPSLSLTPQRALLNKDAPLSQHEFESSRWLVRFPLQEWGAPLYNLRAGDNYILRHPSVIGLGGATSPQPSKNPIPIPHQTGKQMKATT